MVWAGQWPVTSQSGACRIRWQIMCLASFLHASCYLMTHVLHESIFSSNLLTWVNVFIQLHESYFGGISSCIFALCFPDSHTHVQLYHWQKSSTLRHSQADVNDSVILQDNAYEWHPWKWWVSLTTLVLPLGLTSSHCQVHCRIWSCPIASADCNCSTGCLTVC
jgi:hypothetical protein